MTKILSFPGLLVSAAAMFSMASCTPSIRDFGYAPSDSELNEIVVGIDSQDRVAELVGSPSSDSLRGQDAWYYLAARQETIAFKAPKTTDRQLVAISFNSEGTVTTIERFPMQDGRVITLSRRVTDQQTKGVSFLRQAFGNIGRLSTEDIVGTRR